MERVRKRSSWGGGGEGVGFIQSVGMHEVDAHVLKQNGAHHVLLFFEIFLERRKFPEILPASYSHLAEAGSHTQTAQGRYHLPLLLHPRELKTYTPPL